MGEDQGWDRRRSCCCCLNCLLPGADVTHDVVLWAASCRSGDPDARRQPDPGCHALAITLPFGRHRLVNCAPDHSRFGELVDSGVPHRSGSLSPEADDYRRRRSRHPAAGQVQPDSGAGGHPLLPEPEQLDSAAAALHYQPAVQRLLHPRSHAGQSPMGRSLGPHRDRDVGRPSRTRVGVRPRSLVCTLFPSIAPIPSWAGEPLT